MSDTKIPAAIRVDWWYGERVLEGEEELRAELVTSASPSLSKNCPNGGRAAAQTAQSWKSPEKKLNFSLCLAS